jgi:hypothetical protein
MKKMKKVKEKKEKKGPKREGEKKKDQEIKIIILFFV